MYSESISGLVEKLMRHVASSIVVMFAFGAVTAHAAGDIYSTKPLLEDGIHDPFNDAVRILQEPGEAMVDFPLDKNGLIDWVKTLRQDYISPRKSLTGQADGMPEMQELDMDIIMKQTRSMPHVRFPHLAHTQWLACSNCHDKIFIPQYEANPVGMDKILKGEYCGVCHDKVSFPLFNCERCHSVPHDGSGERWW